MTAPTILRIEIPASYHALETVRACTDVLLAREGAPQDSSHLAAEVRLAVHEACTNIIEHAYHSQNGSIRAIFERLSDPARIVIHLYDDGQPFDPDSVPAPDLSEPRTSGYGLFLIRNLMDEVHYQAAPDCNHLELVKFLPETE